MIFSNENIDYGTLKGWNFKFYGKCKDEENKIWFFYTNSNTQFNSFKKGKQTKGMKLIEGFVNPNYGVVKRMIEVKDGNKENNKTED